MSHYIDISVKQNKLLWQYAITNYPKAFDDLVYGIKFDSNHLTNMGQVVRIIFILALPITDISSPNSVMDDDGNVVFDVYRLSFKSESQMMYFKLKFLDEIAID